MKSEKKSFFKNFPLKLLSLLIAFLIWLIVVNVNDYKIVKEYSGNTPIYDNNNNIVGYWLDISENGKYIIYYLDNFI